VLCKFTIYVDIEIDININFEFSGRSTDSHGTLGHRLKAPFLGIRGASTDACTNFKRCCTWTTCDLLLNTCMRIAWINSLQFFSYTILKQYQHYNYVVFNVKNVSFAILVHNIDRVSRKCTPMTPMCMFFVMHFNRGGFSAKVWKYKSIYRSIFAKIALYNVHTIILCL